MTAEHAARILVALADTTPMTALEVLDMYVDPKSDMTPEARNLISVILDGVDITALHFEMNRGDMAD